MSLSGYLGDIWFLYISSEALLRVFFCSQASDEIHKSHISSITSFVKCSSGREDGSSGTHGTGNTVIPKNAQRSVMLVLLADFLRRRQIRLSATRGQRGGHGMTT